MPSLEAPDTQTLPLIQHETSSATLRSLRLQAVMQLDSTESHLKATLLRSRGPITNNFSALAWLLRSQWDLEKILLRG